MGDSHADRDRSDYFPGCLEVLLPPTNQTAHLIDVQIQCARVAFNQVTVAAGESAAVEIAIPATDCSLVDATGRRIVEPGTFELLVGSSSRERDLLKTTFTIAD